MINMLGVVVKKRLIRLIEDYFVLETLVDTTIQDLIHVLSIVTLG